MAVIVEGKNMKADLRVGINERLTVFGRMNEKRDS